MALTTRVSKRSTPKKPRVTGGGGAVLFDASHLSLAQSAGYIHEEIIQSSHTIVTASKDVWDRYCASRFDQFAHCQ